MASYIDITDAEVDPEAPITSYLAYRWRDNPIAIAERASGAPIVKFPSFEILTGSGNWVVPTGVSRVAYIVVGAGGGGSAGAQGGGGGGVAIGFMEVVEADSLAYSVGAGGTGATASPGGDGGDSVFDSAGVRDGPVTGGGGGTGLLSPGSNGGTATSGSVANIVGRQGITAAYLGTGVIALGGTAFLVGMGLAETVGYVYGTGGGEGAGSGDNGAPGTILLFY